MRTRTMQFFTRISAPIEKVFDAIADLPKYGDWLPHSSAFGGIADVSPYPVQLGTRYREIGPVEKPGTVTEFVRPRCIAFHHVVLIRKPLKIDVDAKVRYILEPTAEGVSVERVLTVEYGLPFLLSWLAPIVVQGFRRENLRTLDALKRYLEAQ